MPAADPAPPPTSVLDASALLAMLHREQGGSIVARAIDEGAAIGVVNLAEVLTKLVEKGRDPQQVRHYILEEAPPTFSRRQLERSLPGISQATIRLVLNELRDGGQIELEGKGPSAKWRVNPPL